MYSITGGQVWALRRRTAETPSEIFYRDFLAKTGRVSLSLFLSRPKRGVGHQGHGLVQFTVDLWVHLVCYLKHCHCHCHYKCQMHNFTPTTRLSNCCFRDKERADSSACPTPSESCLCAKKHREQRSAMRWCAQVIIHTRTHRSAYSRRD